MSDISIGYALIAGLILLLALGVPIGISLILAGACGLFAVRGVGAASYLIETFAYSTASSLALVVIPLFIFMGHLAFSAGLSEKAYKAAKSWTGHIPGGLPIATVFACAGFATVCGSSVATAATVAPVTVPEMLRAGYSQRLAGGCVAAAGALGVLIPPSGILIIYSIATNVSIADLFIGAIVPGILTAIAYAGLITLTVRRDKDLVARTVLPKEKFSTAVRHTLEAWEVVVLFLAVVGTIYFGLATATEAAGIGALLALVFAFVRRGSSGSIYRGMLETGSSTATIFILIVGSALFSTALATTQLPTVLAAEVASLNLSPTELLFLLLIPYLILGCFMDGISMIFITMPLVFPIIREAGINPVLFGIIITKMVEIGAMTPPVGLNVYVVQGAVPELKLGEVFRGVTPFVFMEFVVLALLIFFPALVTMPLR